MKLLKADDLKFFLYISTAKTKMLYHQFAKENSRTKSVECNLKLPTVSIKRNTTSEERVEREEMVVTVTQPVVAA